MLSSAFPRLDPGGASPIWPDVRRTAALAAVLAVTASCVDITGSGGSDDSASRLLSDLQCSISEEDLFDGGIGVDGIPSLQNPEFVAAGDPAVSYLDNTSRFPDPRVVGIVVDGQAYAIPHNILWWHEIVNLDFPSGLRIAVTYCPLTGSVLVFDRSAIDGAELGVSGLILNNNLVMYDRSTEVSLWPQMMRQAGCGSRDETVLPMFPAASTTWSGWTDLHPSTLVVSSLTDIPRDYTRYPYLDYKRTRDLLFPQNDIDDRRPMKEWVLGIPSEDGRGGIAFPFGALRIAEEGNAAAVHSPSPRGDVVVLWDTRVEGAMAFVPEVDGTRLNFRVEDSRILDEETGSEWRMDGRAVAGPLEGATLEPVPEAYPAFWFAWAAFQPDTEIWTP